MSGTAGGGPRCQSRARQVPGKCQASASHERRLAKPQVPFARMAGTEVYAGPAATPDAAATPSVSVVVTVFDERGTIEQLHSRTVAALEETGRPFELIFVDDGSTDGTWAVLERLHDADPRVRAVRFKRNFGQHPAMHAGLVRAR